MKKLFLLFSGYNERAVVCFCRFCEKYTLPYVIVAANNEDKILSTTYSNRVLITRDNKSLDIKLFDKINEEVKSKLQLETTSICIVPTSEYLIKFVLINRDLLEERGYNLPLVNLEVYEKFSNKYAFNELCLKENIPVPAEFQSMKNLKFPVILKPKVYTLEKQYKPVIIDNEEEFPQYINLNDFYIQEYVDGDSYYLLMHIDKEHNIRMFSQENLIQQDNGLSIVLARSSEIHREFDFSKFTNLLLKHRFTGLIMIELKKCGDLFYMIEANPRLWGPLQLTIDANMGLLEAFVKDNGFDVSVEENEYIVGWHYYWSGGILQDLGNKRELKFYNITKEGFFNHLHAIQPHDIYLKEDTLKLYLANQ